MFTSFDIFSILYDEKLSHIRKMSYICTQMLQTDIINIKCETYQSFLLFFLSPSPLSWGVKSGMRFPPPRLSLTMAKVYTPLCARCVSGVVQAMSVASTA